MEPIVKQNYISINHHQRAEHAMSSWLLSCTINSGLAVGQIIDSHDSLNNFLISTGETARPVSWCLVSKSSTPEECFTDDHVLFGIPLICAPLHDKSGRVTLIDPKEFGFPILHQRNSRWEILSNPASTLMNQVQAWYPELPTERSTQICEELKNSVVHLAHVYAISGGTPLPSLEDSAMAWEQSIIESHPLHSMHKSRYAIPSIPNIPFEADMLHPKIRFVVVQNIWPIPGHYVSNFNKIRSSLLSM